MQQTYYMVRPAGDTEDKGWPFEAVSVTMWGQRKTAEDFIARLMAEAETAARGPYRVVEYTMTAMIDVPVGAWTDVEARP
jgi:hypothetical protein